MAKNSVRFKRFPAAFDEVARARLCKSSGSKHSAAAAEDGSADLSELVESFLERKSGVEEERCEDGKGEGEMSSCDESESYSGDTETTNMLLSLIQGRRHELAMEGCSPGLCKSRWEQTAKSPAAVHEYIDVIISGSRYIAEVSPITHFTIVRPTDTYASLLEFFPRILVCEEDNLKTVVRPMCARRHETVLEEEGNAPPWRRLAYMKAKWFGTYKRTTNSSSRVAKVAAGGGSSAGKKLKGFKTLQATRVSSRGQVGREVGFGFHVSSLDAALNGIP